MTSAATDRAGPRRQAAYAAPLILLGDANDPDGKSDLLARIEGLLASDPERQAVDHPERASVSA